MRSLQSVVLSIASIISIAPAPAPAAAERSGNKQCGLTVPSSVTSRPNKVLIAHRGASFHLPEHTLVAYRLALELGADYIEPDLVATKDGKLVAYHSLDLNATTNVATVFPPDRMSHSEFANRTGYWIYDFTLEDVQKLTVRQRLPEARSTVLDGHFKIPTLQEILVLLDTWNNDVLPQLTSAKKRAGMYVEIKDPKWFAVDTQLKPADLFLTELKASPHTTSMFNDTDCGSLKFDEYLTPPLVIQCFDGETLKYLSEQWTQNYGTSPPPPMVLLGGFEDCLEEDWWFHIGEWTHFVHGVGPDKKCFAEETSAKSIIERAREHELAVHVWTERPETTFVLDNFDNVEQEMDYLLCKVGVDGLFTEDIVGAAVLIAKGCGEAPPTASPTAAASLPDETDCPDVDEHSPYLAFATGIMGFLVGILSTVFSMNSRFCKSRRQTRRQLRIPTHEDVEMI